MYTDNTSYSENGGKEIVSYIWASFTKVGWSSTSTNASSGYVALDVALSPWWRLSITYYKRHPEERCSTESGPL